jgi:hypothetical protein
MQFDRSTVLIANLMNASRAAGFCRGKGIDDTADNRAEDAALVAIRDEIERLRAALLRCRGMVGHPDNIALIDAALEGAVEQKAKPDAV